MGKKAKAPRPRAVDDGDKEEAADAPPTGADLELLDALTAEDFAWLGDPARVAAARHVDAQMTPAECERRHLEATLPPAVASTRDAMRAIASGHVPAHPLASTVATFHAYAAYLADLKACFAADGFDPDPVLDEQAAGAAHVASCLARLARGEGITARDACRASTWLRSALDGDYLFTCDEHD